MSIGPWDFNGFDIVVLLVIIVSFVTAFVRGLVRELVSVIALVAALGISLFIWGRFRFAMQDFVQPSWLSDMVLGLGIFSLVYLLITFPLAAAAKFLRGGRVGPVDRLLGGGFGAARGLIIAALATMLLTAQYRSGQDVQEFRDYYEANRPEFSDDFLEEMPESMQDQMEVEAPELPVMLQNSTFFPLLDRIGDGIRALPFNRMKNCAERLKDGLFEGCIRGGI
ncbi:MAG: CvpA family protein [Hyphomonadaceae bacterium]|nr:CvpA family protein [Hyphomonadaceae bacterium]MBC6412727.1 CvpA family protein [Hyphomonadaceae bacterium]